MSDVDGLDIDVRLIVVFLGIGLSMAVLCMVLNAILERRKRDPEKNSAYECGFNAVDDAQMKFDVRF